MTLSAGRLLWAAALASCTGETDIVVGEPDLRAPPGSLSFGEVQVGKAVTLTLELHNDGIGAVALSGAWAGDDDIEILEIPDEIPPNGSAEVRVTFAPSAEGPHEGVLALDTNDEERPRIELPTAGTGVVPRIVVNPETLYFGEVAAGDSVTRTTSITSSGSGPLTVTSLAFPASEADAYTWTLPEGYAVPFTLPPGYALALALTYAPLGDEALSGDLVVASDDPARPYVPVRLLAGSEDGGTQPPDLQILTPAWGTAWLTTEPVAVEVQAVDPDDAPEDLTVLLYVDGKLIGTASPDATGRFAQALEPMGVGLHEILARAVDPDGGIDEDSVDVDVQGPDDLHYTLSGGSSVFEYWSVDDDVVVLVDGIEALDDDDGHQSTHPPLSLAATVGSSIRIVASDANACRKAIDELWLHFGTARSQRLIDATSASSCPADADYDPAYTGPWPNTFLDETITVATP